MPKGAMKTRGKNNNSANLNKSGRVTEAAAVMVQSEQPSPSNLNKQRKRKSQDKVTDKCFKQVSAKELRMEKETENDRVSAV